MMNLTNMTTQQTGMAWTTEIKTPHTSMNSRTNQKTGMAWTTVIKTPHTLNSWPRSKSANRSLCVSLHESPQTTLPQIRRKIQARACPKTNDHDHECFLSLLLAGGKPKLVPKPGFRLKPDTPETLKFQQTTSLDQVFGNTIQANNAQTRRVTTSGRRKTPTLRQPVFGDLLQTPNINLINATVEAVLSDKENQIVDPDFVWTSVMKHHSVSDCHDVRTHVNRQVNQHNQLGNIIH